MAGATITLNVDQLPDDLTGQQVRQLRAHFGQTQTQFAKTMGCKIQTIGRWERGECEVPGTARQLLKVLQRVRLTASGRCRIVLRRPLFLFLRDGDKTRTVVKVVLLCAGVCDKLKKCLALMKNLRRFYLETLFLCV